MTGEHNPRSALCHRLDTFQVFINKHGRVCVCVCLRDEDAPAKIEDPDALKPEGWLDDEAEFVSDPSAEKPEDW